MKVKTVLLACGLFFVLSMFTNSANAQYWTFSEGYELGFDYGRMYARAGEIGPVYEYRYDYEGLKWRRYQVDYYSYNSILSQINTWIQYAPEKTSYYRGFHEGLVDGFILNIPPWECISPYVTDIGGGMWIPSEP